MDPTSEPIESALTSETGRRCLDVVTKDLRKPYTVEQVRVVLRAKGRCEYCGADVIASQEAWYGSDWDHIIPHRFGRDDGSGNIALACRSCNSLKSDDLPESGEQELRKLSRERRVALIRPWLKLRREQAGVTKEYKAFKELVEQVTTGDRGGVVA